MSTRRPDFATIYLASSWFAEPEALVMVARSQNHCHSTGRQLQIPHRLAAPSRCPAGRVGSSHGCVPHRLLSDYLLMVRFADNTLQISTLSLSPFCRLCADTLHVDYYYNDDDGCTA